MRIVESSPLDLGVDDLELYPVNKDILVDKTRDILREAIVTGHIAQGQRINETTIARQLNVSRGPVREGLAALENEGLVSRIPNRGMFVVKFTRNDVEELYALRTMYEVFALRYTLAHNRSLPVDELAQKIAEMEHGCQNDASGMQMPAADMTFHTALIMASGLTRLISVWSELTPQLQMLMHRRNDVGMNVTEVIVPAHTELLEALRTYDADKCEAALRDHIDDSYQVLIRSWPDVCID